MPSGPLGSRGWHPELLELEEVTDFHIQLYPTSNVFKAGYRLRVGISGSYFPRFSCNLITGEPVATGTRTAIAEQRVLHSTSYPSRIVLPVVPR